MTTPHSVPRVPRGIPSENLDTRLMFEEYLRGSTANIARVHGYWWSRHELDVPSKKLGNVSEPTQTVSHIESRLEELEKKVQSAIDIGLENRKLLGQLLEEESRIGLGAIHSLDQGRVQLSHPLIYNYQVLGDEVVAGIEELRVYGVGATEFEAVRELQEELRSLVQDLDQTLPEKLGAHLLNTLETLKGRMKQSAVDA